MAGQAGLGKRTPHLGKGTVVPLPLSVGSSSKLEKIASEEIASC